MARARSEPQRKTVKPDTGNRTTTATTAWLTDCHCYGRRGGEEDRSGGGSDEGVV